jgi:eukaryotic-like serine/threonine-protein kinase
MGLVEREEPRPVTASLHQDAQPDASLLVTRWDDARLCRRRGLHVHGFFQFDIWVLSIGDRKTRAVIHTAANEVTPEFSPDGRWLAYASNESGRHEVYVQPYPGPGERHLISTNGGEQPAWSTNGRELFYVQGGLISGRGVPTLMSVRIATAPVFQAGTPETVFENADLNTAWGRSYDVAPDGRRFLLALNKEAPTSLAPAQMIFVQHWFEELKRLVPKK